MVVLQAMRLPESDQAVSLERCHDGVGELALGRRSANPADGMSGEGVTHAVWPVRPAHG